MSHGAAGCRLGHHIRDELVRRGVPKAKFWQLGMDTIFLLILFLEHVKPTRSPGIVVQGLEDLFRPSEEPHNQLSLVARERLVLHASAAHGEGVEVRDHGLHLGLCVRDEQPSWVHGFAFVVLIKDHLRVGAATDGVQVHVHEGRLGPAPGLPAHDGREVCFDDVHLTDKWLRQVETPTLRLEIIDLLDRLLLYVQTVGRVFKGGLQELLGLLP
mmetsp:Transcript_26449/g.61419  ORF Transcript_26449/g.61419 Transcript_26449/m.61419 type:complete len:214 (-) Transcript_26449:1411-2052(-)